MYPNARSHYTWCRNISYSCKPIAQDDATHGMHLLFALKSDERWKIVTRRNNFESVGRARNDLTSRIDPMHNARVIMVVDAKLLSFEAYRYTPFAVEVRDPANNVTGVLYYNTATASIKVYDNVRKMNEHEKKELEMFRLFIIQLSRGQKQFVLQRGTHADLSIAVKHGQLIQLTERQRNVEYGARHGTADNLSEGDSSEEEGSGTIVANASARQPSPNGTVSGQLPNVEIETGTNATQSVNVNETTLDENDSSSDKSQTRRQLQNMRLDPNGFPINSPESHEKFYQAFASRNPGSGEALREALIRSGVPLAGSSTATGTIKRAPMQTTIQMASNDEKTGNVYRSARSLYTIAVTDELKETFPSGNDIVMTTTGHWQELNLKAQRYDEMLKQLSVHETEAKRQRRE